MLALIEAYNDWHIEEWAGLEPGRMIPMALLPLWDIDLAITELKRMKARGCEVVTFPEQPTAYGLPSIHSGHWDRLFSVITDLDMTVAIHIGTSGGTAQPPSLDSPADVGNTLINIQIVEPVADLIFSPILRNNPGLRIAMSEGCMGWVPFLKERADAAYRNHRFWTHQDLGKLMPSDLIERHFLFCFHEDNFGLRVRHEVGIQQIAWECDFPHCDSTWPKSPELLWESVSEFPREEIDLITHGNAMRFLQFDPFRHIARADASVSALRARATHIDVTPRSMGGESPTRALGALSTGDIRRFMAASEKALGAQVALL
jgi:predicted TIM-barrel fold metal-dependent hydrolase